MFTIRLAQFSGTPRGCFRTISNKKPSNCVIQEAEYTYLNKSDIHSKENFKQPFSKESKVSYKDITFKKNNLTQKNFEILQLFYKNSNF